MSDTEFTSTLAPGGLRIDTYVYRAGEAHADGRTLGYPTFEAWIGAFG